MPVISVGALNPNGTKAVFSNDGTWVTAWALGAAVVSTYPVDINASRTPELRMPSTDPGARPGRESLDPTTTPAASRSGAARRSRRPAVAALVAGSLLDGAARIRPAAGPAGGAGDAGAGGRRG